MEFLKCCVEGMVKALTILEMRNAISEKRDPDFSHIKKYVDDMALIIAETSG